MQDHSPLSPEERRKRSASLSAAFGRDVAEKLRPREQPWEVVKRVAVGVYNDGFIHAGNLAYLALLALFPFFILAAALAQSARPVRKQLERPSPQCSRSFRPTWRDVLREPVAEVLTARTGPLLWIGAIVGLWTVGSFIETIRDILRRAYGVNYCAPFWKYRLGSMAVDRRRGVPVDVRFGPQRRAELRSARDRSLAPVRRGGCRTRLTLYRVIPARSALFGTIYFLFFLLTPLAVSPPAAAASGRARCSSPPGGWRLPSCFPTRSACSAATTSPTAASPA